MSELEGSEDSASEISSESQSLELQTYRKVMNATIRFLSETSPGEIKGYFEAAQTRPKAKVKSSAKRKAKAKSSGSGAPASSSTKRRRTT